MSKVVTTQDPCLHIENKSCINQKILRNNKTFYKQKIKNAGYSIKVTKKPYILSNLHNLKVQSTYLQVIRQTSTLASSQMGNKLSINSIYHTFRSVFNFSHVDLQSLRLSIICNSWGLTKWKYWNETSE